MNNINWNLIHSFLAVVENGSLLGAARSLGVSQPKLTRDIQSLEAQTKLNLFKRTNKGLNLTSSGKSLVESAQKMNKFALKFNRQVQGSSTEITGNVRISANEIIGLYLLPAVIASFRQLHPSVTIDVLITNKVSSLSKRDADIALRMFRPTQLDLVINRLPDMELGFFAHEKYIQKNGAFSSIEDFKNFTIIGYDESMEFINGAAASGYVLKRDDFKLRTDNLIMQINLAKQGAGIIVTHKKIMQSIKYMQEIKTDISLPIMPFWIVCHADTQYNARIRTFRKFLIDWFENDPYHGLSTR